MKLLNLDDNRANRNRWTWSKLNVRRAQDIKQVFDDLQDYWPLTERQAFYRLISSGLTKQTHWHKYNNPDYEQVDVYKALGRTLKWMRIDDILPWEALTDEHRIITVKAGSPDMETFIESELNNFLRGYQKCLAQSQDRYIEVWIEKAALLHIVEPIADIFCRRVVCCKGYNSITFQADFYQRAKDARKIGQRPTVLYFGDFDPSGENMIYAAMQTLQDELGLSDKDVDYYRCGINPEHFDSLQADAIPIKPTDSRAPRFIERHGTIAYELDAFHPEELKQLVYNSIAAHTDMEMIEQYEGEEKEEVKRLRDIKEKVKGFIVKLL